MEGLLLKIEENLYFQILPDDKDYYDKTLHRIYEKTEIVHWEVIDMYKKIKQVNI